MFMIKNFIMKIMQFQFYLLLWCQTAETLTEQLTDLGQNVTINCDLHKEEVYWLLLKLPHPPVIILRTLPSGPFYYSERFNNKYSVQSKHHLFIYNVTLDELGVYYCMITDTLRKEFSNGTRLYIIETPKDTVVTHFDQNPTTCTIIIIMCGLVNGVLIIVVIGLSALLFHKRETTRSSSKQLQVMNYEQLQDLTQIQYVLVDTPTLCERF